MRNMRLFEKITKTIKHFQVKQLIAKSESVYKEQLKYLYLPKNSESLLIVFSGFTGETRKYNYISSFMDLPVDQLYILDTWGFKGSYYWLDKGNDNPERIVNGFIENFIMQHSFKHVYTCGSSKGGTAAIYFGLMNNVERIYAGACQFRVGTYLNTVEHMPILEAMIGDSNKDEMVEALDKKVEHVITNYNGKGHIFLFYSTKEPTYDNHIIPLIKSLRGKVVYSEQKAAFLSHSDVGIYFPTYVHGEVLSLSNVV